MPALAPAPAQAGTSGPGLARQSGLIAGPAAGTAIRPALLPATRISRHCRGQNTTPKEATDSTGHHVYVVWEGCHGIGFARSADGGIRSRSPVRLPGSSGAFDPVVAVAPNGTVYAVFMKQTAHHQFPVVDTSFDHGRASPRCPG